MEVNRIKPISQFFDCCFDFDDFPLVVFFEFAQAFILFCLGFLYLAFQGGNGV